MFACFLLVIVSFVFCLHLVCLFLGEKYVMTVFYIFLLSPSTLLEVREGFQLDRFLNLLKSMQCMNSTHALDNVCWEVGISEGWLLCAVKNICRKIITTLSLSLSLSLTSQIYTVSIKGELNCNTY